MLHLYLDPSISYLSFFLRLSACFFSSGFPDWKGRLATTQVSLGREAFPSDDGGSSSKEGMTKRMVAFGWGAEDVSISLADMAAKGMEATYSMGDDAPLAVLSALPHVPYNYFRQRFAQVTNPPIDPLREGEVSQ